MRAITLVCLMAVPGSLLAQRGTVREQLISNPGAPAIVPTPLYAFGNTPPKGRQGPPFLQFTGPALPPGPTWRVLRSENPRGPYTEVSVSVVNGYTFVTSEDYTNNQALAGLTVWYRLEGMTEGLAFPTFATQAFPVDVPGWLAPLAGLTLTKTAYPLGINIVWTGDPQVTQYRVGATSGSVVCGGTAGTATGTHTTSLRGPSGEPRVVTVGSTWSIKVDGVYHDTFMRTATAAITIQ